MVFILTSHMPKISMLKADGEEVKLFGVFTLESVLFDDFLEIEKSVMLTSLARSEKLSKDPLEALTAVDAP